MVKRESFTPQVQVPHPENWESALYETSKYDELLQQTLEEYKVSENVWSPEVFREYMVSSLMLADDIFVETLGIHLQDLSTGVPRNVSVQQVTRAMASLNAPFISLWRYFAKTREKVSFTAWRDDPILLDLCARELEFYKVLGMGVIEQSLMTDRVIRYAQLCYHHWGKKLFTISLGLAWQLNNTELRKLPSVLFQLPYPALHLVIPTSFNFQVYNEQDGWCVVSGVYLTEDVSELGERMIRLLVTSVDKGPTDGGTSVYYWNIFLREDSTLEEDIQYSIDYAKTSTQKEPYLNWSDRLATFEMMLPHLLSLFRFVVNVMLYATHPSADKAEVFSDHPDFQGLYKRALAAKGKKRERLFQEVNAAKTPPRTYLGGSIRVTREERENVAAFKKEGKSQTIRTYVMQHWQHIWSGPMDGERKCTYQLIKAYWRGPEVGAVSNKTHHLT